MADCEERFLSNSKKSIGSLRVRSLFIQNTHEVLQMRPRTDIVTSTHRVAMVRLP